MISQGFHCTGDQFTGAWAGAILLSANNTRYTNGHTGASKHRNEMSGNSEIDNLK